MLLFVETDGMRNQRIVETTINICDINTYFSLPHYFLWLEEMKKKKTSNHNSAQYIKGLSEYMYKTSGRGVSVYGTFFVFIAHCFYLPTFLLHAGVKNVFHISHTQDKKRSLERIIPEKFQHVLHFTQDLQNF